MLMRRLRTVVQKVKSGFRSSTSTRPTQLTTTYHETSSVLLYKVALLAGFSLLGISVFAANQAPASGYEVSIYWATSGSYWLGISGALTVALATLLYDYENRLAPLSMVLALTSVASFIALPVIRNYYFHGYADPMTHLGRIRALATGFSSFMEPVYPGTYAATTLLSSFSGLSVNRSMLYVMFLFGLVFLVFVPLTVRAVVPGRLALVLGLFSGLLLLPINNISLFYRFHPFSLASLYFPLVAYLVVSHVTAAHDSTSLPRGWTGASLAMPIATVGLLFFHPQATVNTLIIFGMIVALHVAVRRVVPGHTLAQQRAIYGQFVLLAALFLLWVSLHQTGAGRTAATLVDGVLGMLTGNSETAELVQTRTSSANAIEVSIVELFVKYFLVSGVFSLLATGAIVATLLGKLPDVPADSNLPASHPHVVTLFAVGGAGLLPYIFVHSFGRADDYLFRHVGFWMVVVTILGALGLFYLVRGLSMRLGDSTRVLKHVLGTAAVVLIVLSLVSVYSSPFLYLPGQHVSEQEMDGMKAGFEMQPQDRSVWFGGIRKNPNRYEEAVFAAPNVSWDGSPRIRATNPVPNDNLTRLVQFYERHPEQNVRRDHYLMISEQDYETETAAYDSLRYTRENLASVAEQPEVYTIYSNGEARVYYVDTAGTPLTADARNATDGTVTNASVDEGGVSPSTPGGDGVLRTFVREWGALGAAFGLVLVGRSPGGGLPA